MNSPLKKALITGCCGQDGSYLAELLLRKDYQVIGVNRHHGDIHKVWRLEEAGVLTHPSFALVTGDVTDAASIQEIVLNVRPDEIYHLAAQSYVGRSWQDAALTIQTNVLGTLNVLEAVRRLGPGGAGARVLIASTSEMFGRTRPPQNEYTKFEPVSPYGIAKLAAHQLAGNYREAYKMFVSCSISFNHESPRRGESFVTRKIVMAFARAALSGERVYLKLGRLSSQRDWGHAADYVEAMWRILQLREPMDLVLGTGKRKSVFDIIETCKKEEPAAKVEIEANAADIRPVDDLDLCADPTRARFFINWSPEISFEAMIRQMLTVEKARIVRATLKSGDSYEKKEEKTSG